MSARGATHQSRDMMSTPPLPLPRALPIGWTKAQHKSLNIFYSADHQGIRALLGFLTEDCCQGRPELCGVRPPEATRASSP